MLSFLSLLLRRKKVIMIAAGAGFALSAAVSMILPHKYRSMGAFIPGGVEQELAGSSSFLARLGAISESYATLVRVRQNYIIDYVVRSNRMAGLMDERFDLRGMYGKETLAEARRELSKRTYVSVRDEGVIEVAIEAPGAVLARDMTAACIGFVDSILVDLIVENAESKVRYLEGHLEKSLAAREEADSSVARLMRERGIYQMESQAEATFTVIGTLNARLRALEIEKNIMGMSLHDESEDIARMSLEIEKISEEIERVTLEGSGDGLFPPLTEIPELMTEYLGLVAERMAQEFVIAFVRLKLEDARLSGRKSEGAIRVIDPPVVPEMRSWPKRKQIVIVITLASVLWAGFVTLILEKRAAGIPGAGGGDASNGEKASGGENA